MSGVGAARLFGEPGCNCVEKTMVAGVRGIASRTTTVDLTGRPKRGSRGSALSGAPPQRHRDTASTPLEGEIPAAHSNREFAASAPGGRPHDSSTSCAPPRLFVRTQQQHRLRTLLNWGVRSCGHCTSSATTPATAQRSTAIRPSTMYLGCLLRRQRAADRRDVHPAPALGRRHDLPGLTHRQHGSRPRPGAPSVSVRIVPITQDP